MNVTFYTLASTKDPDNIRYVGKTTQTLRRRLQGHICCAKKAKKQMCYTNHNYNWINEQLSEGYDIIIEEIETIECNEDSVWKLYEKYWILQFRVWGFKLCNIREGGEDNYVPHPTEEAIKKRADKIRGIPRSEETKRKISEGLTGITRSEETKQKVRDSIVALQGKPVIQYDYLGNFIKRWDYLTLAANELNLDKANLSACCYRKKHFCGGFVWRFEGDDLIDIDMSKYIVCLDMNFEIKGIYRTYQQAVEETNISETSIRKSIKNESAIKNLYFYKYNDFYKE